MVGDWNAESHECGRAKYAERHKWVRVDELALSVVNSSAMSAKPSSSSALNIREWRLLREDIPIASKCHPLFV